MILGVRLLEDFDASIVSTLLKTCMFGSWSVKMVLFIVLTLHTDELPEKVLDYRLFTVKFMNENTHTQERDKISDFLNRLLHEFLVLYHS